MTYFKNNWINGPLTKRPNVWNYYEFIGRQTNNDVEGFNRICNRVLRAKNPNIYKFIDALKRFDQEMSLQVEYFKKNPLNPYGYPKSANFNEHSFNPKSCGCGFPNYHSARKFTFIQYML